MTATNIANTTNSAHDDIQLTIDASDLPKYHQLLTNMRFGEPGDALNLLDLIVRINQASAQENAQVEHICFHFSHQSTDIQLVFKAKVVQQPNWLSDFEDKLAQFLTPQQAQEIDAILSVDPSAQLFEISFCAPKITPLKLDDLYASLDIYKIGRPSSLPDIISKLEALGMIALNQDQVILSAKGLQTYLVFNQQRKGLADKTFSTQLASLEQEIERDEISIEAALAKLLPAITAEPKSAQLAQGVWHDIDDLYAADDEVDFISEQGLIQIQSVKRGHGA